MPKKNSEEQGKGPEVVDPRAAVRKEQFDPLRGMQYFKNPEEGPSNKPGTKNRGE